jgi:hypothetical protein
MISRITTGGKENNSIFDINPTLLVVLNLMQCELLYHQQNLSPAFLQEINFFLETQ